MRLLTVVLLLVFLFRVAPVEAQMVRTCVARDGHVTLTSHPCAPSETTVAAVHAPPERTTPERQAALERRLRQEDANSAWLQRAAGFGAGSGTRTARGSPSAVEDRHERCQAARTRREAARSAMGMNVRYQALRQLDDMVWDACR